MRLTGRVRTLERGGAAAAVCPRCKGEGWPGFVMSIEGDPAPPPTGGCEACGKLISLKEIIFPRHADMPRGPDGLLDQSFI